MVGVGSLVVSLMISLAGSSEWMRWLQFRHAVPFGIADPILGYDVGFYIFRLPLFDLAQQVAIAVLIVAMLGSAAAYVLAGALNFTKRGGVSVAGKARLHLSLLAVRDLPVVRRQCVPGGAPSADGRPDTRHRARRVLRRRRGADAGAARADGRGPPVCGALGLSRVLVGHLADPARHRSVPRDLCRRLDVRGGDSAVRRHAQRTGRRDAVHRPQHRRDAAGVQSGRHPHAQCLGRRRADAGRHRPQPRHDQERAPLGPPAAARHVRPDSGIAHVLRLRLGRQRSLRD